jgi:hypothetical protein
VEVGVASKMAGTVISWKIHAELSPRKVYHKYYVLLQHSARQGNESAVLGLQEDESNN